MKQANFPPQETECPFCRERIPGDAVKCRHCGSFLGGRVVKREEEPTLLSALVANVFMPGLGSWRLGAKFRGAVIVLSMIACISMAGMNYVSGISRQMDAAFETRDDVAFDASFSSTENTTWVTLSAVIFAGSFVDIFLIYAQKKRKGSGPSGKR